MQDNPRGKVFGMRMDLTEAVWGGIYYNTPLEVVWVITSRFVEVPPMPPEFSLYVIWDLVMLSHSLRPARVCNIWLNLSQDSRRAWHTKSVNCTLISEALVSLKSARRHVRL